MKKILALLAISVAAIFLLSPSNVFAEREAVDKIAAIVGDEVILVSELAGQIQLMALQTGRQPKNEKELKQFQKDILEQMISDRLFLISAKQDTSLKVRAEEIEQMLDEQVSRISQNFDTYDDFLAALAAEGLSIRDLKKKYRLEVENQLLKQRYIQRKLYSVSISKHEVEEFYREFKDSIPSQPEAVKLAHILLGIKPSARVEDSVKSLANELRQRIIDGADFASISAQYSSNEAGVNGGDLGYVSREDVVPEFARTAFNLSVGDISGVIKTQFGYHIVKCEGKKEDRMKLRHVLLAVSPSAADTAAASILTDSLLAEIRNGADFEQLAKAFSGDDETRASGGELGWFATNQMPPEFVETVRDWKTPGEVRGPVVSRFGLHILKLLDYQPYRELVIENDFDRIKELARQDKTGKIIDEWIEDIKRKTHIQYLVEL